MLISVFNFLHIAPLAVIFGLIIIQMFKKDTKSSINSALIALSSVGILAGTFDHHHAHFAVDPCVGYSIALAYVALKSFVSSKCKAKASN